MRPLQVSVLTALLCIFCMTGTSMSFQCEVPNWDDSVGPDPFPERQGKVVLVAFLKGYCGYCVHQAEKMYALKNELMEEGYDDIDMLIINGGEVRSRELVSNLVNASPIPVIQDTEENVLFSQVFQAHKDDFLVYDRCNQAAIYIPTPYSDLESTITKRVLMSVHTGRHSCYCAWDYAPPNLEDMMLGDDPGVRFYQAHDMTRNILDCNLEDLRCMQFRRGINMERNRVAHGGRGTTVALGRGRLRRILRRMREREESLVVDVRPLGGTRNQGQTVVDGGRRGRYGRRFGLGRRVGNYGRRGLGRGRGRGGMRRRLGGNSRVQVRERAGSL